MDKNIKRSICTVFDRNERAIWRRKFATMQDILNDELSPIENQILDLIGQKNVIIDKIQEIRLELVEGCIHPDEYLVEKDNYVECKFCNKKVKISTKNGN